MITLLTLLIILFNIFYKIMLAPLLITHSIKKIGTLNGKLKINTILKDELKNELFKSIKYIYEDIKTNNISKKKIFFIALFLNITYGFALYIGTYQNSLLQDYHYKSIFFFTIFGTLSIYLQEYFSYYITRSAISKYMLSNKLKNLIYSILKIIFIFFLLPSLLVILVFINTSNPNLKLFTLLLSYFTPPIIFIILFGFIDIQIGVYKYLLIVPFLSIFLPYILLILYNKYTIRFLSKILETLSFFLAKLNISNKEKKLNKTMLYLFYIGFLIDIFGAFIIYLIN